MTDDIEIDVGETPEYMVSPTTEKNDIIIRLNTLLDKLKSSPELEETHETILEATRHIWSQRKKINIMRAALDDLID